MTKMHLTMVTALALSSVLYLGCRSRSHELHSKETVLKNDLYAMRDAINQYTEDKKKAPQDLDTLVRTGYLRNIPTDPFTGSNATWQAVQDDVFTLGDVPLGITDVHSGSSRISSEGTPYSSW